MKAIAIGVDAGGTQTTAIAYDAQGRAVGEGKSGFGNPLIDGELAVRHIIEAAAQALPSGAEVDVLYVGAAGAAGADVAARLEQALTIAVREHGIATNLCVTTDAQLALEARLGSRRGVLLIAGRGSIAYAQHEGVMLRAGGWGHLLGDDGGGYGIARDAVRHLLQEADETGAQGPLSRMLLSETGTDTPRACIDWFHSTDKPGVAALSRVVDRLAREGNEVARDILRRGSAYLAGFVLTLCRRLNMPAGFALAEQGGVLAHAFGVREELYRLLREAGYVPVQVEACHPAYAAYRLMRGELGTRL